MAGGLERKDDPKRPLGGIGYPRTLRLLVADKNINPDTLLATDYLNHFNEIIMLLDLVVDMPDCFEDVRSWAPKSYPQHFIDTNFADRDLAILAYENAPQRYRQPFDQVIEQMDAIVAAGIKQIGDAVASFDQEQLSVIVPKLTLNLQSLVDLASAIIHGREITAGQSEIDALMQLEEGEETDALEDSTSIAV